MLRYHSTPASDLCVRTVGGYMDPLSIANAFATVIGLICNYKSERQSISENEYSNFMEWLNDKNLDQFIEYLTKNKQLSESINAFLNENNEILIAKLNGIDDILSDIASRIGGLSEIAKAINPSLGLSKQSISILRQLDKSGASSFIEHRTRDEKLYQFYEGGKGKVVYDEPRFIEDDLNTLIEYGFLRLDYVGSGTRVFYLTRQAKKFIELI
jgi:hypothetical protein